MMYKRKDFLKNFVSVIESSSYFFGYKFDKNEINFFFDYYSNYLYLTFNIEDFIGFSTKGHTENLYILNKHINEVSIYFPYQKDVKKFIDEVSEALIYYKKNNYCQVSHSAIKNI